MHGAILANPQARCEKRLAGRGSRPYFSMVMLSCSQRNLGERASSRSVRWGVLAGGLALGLWLFGTELGMPRQLGWLIALPVAASAYLLISGTFGICIYQSVMGHRGADHGTEAILDPDRRAQMRGRALLALSASVLIACGVAAAFVAST